MSLRRGDGGGGLPRLERSEGKASVAGAPCVPAGKAKLDLVGNLVARGSQNDSGMGHGPGVIRRRRRAIRVGAPQPSARRIKRNFRLVASGEEALRTTIFRSRLKYQSPPPY